MRIQWKAAVPPEGPAGLGHSKVDFAFFISSCFAGATKRSPGTSLVLTALSPGGTSSRPTRYVDLPMTNIQRECAELEKTTLAQVNATAEKYVQPGKTSLLLVGDRANIESGVRELNAGEIVVLDVEGKPVHP